jgi:hypothetical protein
MMSVVFRRSDVRRALTVSAFAVMIAFVLAFWTTRQQAAKTRAVLNSAVERLAALTDTTPPEQSDRTAIAWGYAARLRLGLESPFRLIEAASRDPRLTPAERQTVSWALLGRVLRGETHVVDPASLDLMGPWDRERSASGEQHLALIQRTILTARDPRAAELGVRLAYTLAAAERVVDGSAPLLAAEVAALLADRELARREANVVVRASLGTDPIDVVRKHRARRSFYVERPVLLQPDQELERVSIESAVPVLESLRSMHAVVNLPQTEGDVVAEDAARSFAQRVLQTGLRLPPSAALAVTVQRYLPVIRAHVPQSAEQITRARNAEMLVGAVQMTEPTRAERRAIGRMLLAAAIASRTTAQERVWFEGDSTPGATQVATGLGLSALEFDGDVPAAWRPYFVQSFADGIDDLRRILPALRLEGLTVRFRMRAPTDSALAMHDPRTRTLHLPVVTAAGTLVHELAHDIDRQSARQQDLAGYRSDHVARVSAARLGSARTPARLAASLQALNEELSEASPLSRRQDRPAEVFATRVDWFVATSLARRGRSSGFLSAVQDELLTGHVVHPTRLRASGSTRSLVTALEGMTGVASFAATDQDPSAQTMLRWALAIPLDRRVVAMIVRGDREPWQPVALSTAPPCDAEGRASLLRLAAESRARGWLRQRARWTSDGDRRAWARSMLEQSPWASDAATKRVGELRDYILAQMATAELPSGLTAYAAPFASVARCQG